MAEFIEIGSGGAILDGSVSPGTEYNIFPSGGVLTDGDAVFKIDFHWVAGLFGPAIIKIDTLSDNKAIYKIDLLYSSTGNSDLNPPSFSGVDLERLNFLNPAEVVVGFIIKLGLLWNVRTAVRKDLSLLWNTGELEPFFYRILGKCKNIQCPPIQGLEDCDVTYVRLVQARTIDELCEKLTNLNWIWPIDKVHKMVPGDDGCTTFEEVDICSNSKCAVICLDYDLKTEIGGVSSITFSYNTDTIGGIITDGTATVSFTLNLPNFFYTSIPNDSETTFFGDAEAFPSSHFYELSGGIVTGNSAEWELDEWFYVSEWPSVQMRTPIEAISYNVDVTDSLWFNTSSILDDNPSTSAFSDVSNQSRSEYLVISNFQNGPTLAIDDPTTPDDESHILIGIQIDLNRFASVGSLRDLDIFLVDLDRSSNVEEAIISINMKNIAADWPATTTVFTYQAGFIPVENSNFIYFGELSDFFVVDDTDYTLAENINKNSIGVAIRVEGLLLASAVANVNDLVFTTYSQSSVLDSRIITSGTVDIVSSSWHYTGSGEIVIVPTTTLFLVNYSYVSIATSLLPPDFVSINMSGKYSLHLSYDAIVNTEPELSGTPDIILQHYYYTGSGDVFTAGDALWAASSWFYTPDDFGIIIGGIATPRINLRYAVSGGIISGSSYQANYNPVVEADPIIIGGIPEVVSSAYTLEVVLGEGIILSGDAEATYFVFDVFIGVTSSVTSFQFVFAPDENVPVLGFDDTLLTRCGCLTLPLIMEMGQNIAQGNKLSQFLIRNSFSLPNRFDLRYNFINDSWQANFNFTGLSADSNTFDNWNLVFELKCSGELGGIELGENIWAMAITINQTRLGTPNLIDFDTHILITFPTDGFCVNDNNLSITILINTKANIFTAATIIGNSSAVVTNFILYDNIGLFKTPFWINNPNLFLSINEIKADTPQVRQDMKLYRDQVLELV